MSQLNSAQIRNIALVDHEGAGETTLLEPIVNMEITTPQAFIGDIMSDLNARRGRILCTDIKGDAAIIEAEVPIAEIQSYQAQLKAMTSGEGSYTVAFDHYEIMPPNLQKKVLAQKKA